MTEVERWYAEYRDAGDGHTKAVDKLAVRLGVDHATVKGIVSRVAAKYRYR
jgi:hypothetical protein